MKVVANTRKAQGSGASRRLRRADKVPGIIYGGNSAPTAIELDHSPLYHALRVEAFHSSILDMELDGAAERVLLRDVQWHPYRPIVMHIDFQRIAADRKIHLKVPLHFKGEEQSPAVKMSGGYVSKIFNEIEVVCLPGDLPEFIEVDLSTLSPGQTVHLNDIAMPDGVAAALKGKENPVVVTVTVPSAAEEEPAAAAPAAAPAPAAAAPAKKTDKK